MAGKVEIITDGAGGKIQYTEEGWGKNVCEFFWEFGGDDTIAIVGFTTADEWDATYPWASGRTRKSSHLWRKKCAE